MFRIRKKYDDLPANVADAGKAEGFVFLCQQSALHFGSNRKIAVPTRPVVSLLRHAQRSVVLPCTSRNQESSRNFFELLDERNVMWTHPHEERRTFAYYRYEVVLPVSLGSKIGVMPQNARVDLLKWVCSRH